MTEEEKNQNVSGEAAPADATASPSTRPAIRSRAFRSKLLSRLPQLQASKCDVADALNLYKDMDRLVDLDADAFLQPLEKLAGGQNG